MPKSQPMYRMIADRLTADIRSQRYRSGEKLPGHVKLARMYEVSTITSNRALRELEQEGLVERRSRQGTFVCEAAPAVRSVLVPTSAKENRDCPQLLEYLDGVLMEANARGIQVRLEPFESEALTDADAIRSLGCQGVFQLGAPPHTFPYQSLRLSGLPWVTVGVADGPGHHFVSEDRVAAARLMVESMRQDGLTRIGFIGALRFSNHCLCRTGYLEALRDTGVGSGLVRDAEAKTVTEVLKTLVDSVDSLMIAGGGQMSVMALAFLRAMGSHIPVGLFEESKDTHEFKDEVYFAWLDHTEVGRQAVDVLVSAIEGTLDGSEERLIPPRITKPTRA